MFAFLIVVHIVVCIILIAVILLQAGKGAGLTEAFGGGETIQQVLGTQAPVVLKKATAVSAILFLVTSLLLGMVTAMTGKSLMLKQMQTAPILPEEVEEGTPIEQGAEDILPEKSAEVPSENAVQATQGAAEGQAAAGTGETVENVAPPAAPAENVPVGTQELPKSQ